MIDTIMFDLDGTLLHFSQAAFMRAYFPGLKKVLAGVGLDPDSAIDALWTGMGKMTRDGGNGSNKQRFWEGFSGHLGLAEEMQSRVEDACNNFYVTDFHAVRSILAPTDVSRRLVRAMASKGYDVILATNPVFPLCAVESRLGWAGLETSDFLYISHYSNSSYCKPDPGYFSEILQKMGKEPRNCLMAGNNPSEDMVAGILGAETFLVTDCLENEADVDVSAFRNGTLAQLEEYLMRSADRKESEVRSQKSE